MSRLIRLLEALSEQIGRGVAWLTVLMTLLVFVVVALRYGLDISNAALQESITYLHALVFMLGMAYTLRHDEHVRVDILYRARSPRGKAWTDLLGALLLLLPFSATLFWLCLDYVLSSWRILEGSRDTGGLPFLYLLKSLLLVMPALLALQGLTQALRAVLILRGEALPPVDSLRTEV